MGFWSTEEDKFKNLKDIEGFSELKQKAPEASAAAADDKVTSAETSARIKATSALTFSAVSDKSVRNAQYKKFYPELNPEVVHQILTTGTIQDLANYELISDEATLGDIKKAAIAPLKDKEFENPEAKKKAVEEAEKRAQETFDKIKSGNVTPAKGKADLENYVENELAKAARFIHQNYLLQNIAHLVPQGVTQAAQHSRLLIAASLKSSSNPLGPFYNTESGYKLLTLSTEKLSALVPYIKLYKVSSMGPKATETEILFPTTSLQRAQSGQNFLQSPSAKNRSYFTNRDGFGIKSFEWVLSGQDEVTKFVDVGANLVLYFQDFAQFVAERRGPSGEFTYLDLLLESDPKLRENAVNYIKAVVGWSVPTSASTLFSADELAAVRANRSSLLLTMKEYSLSFDEGTQNSFTLQIEYHSAYENAIKGNKVNILLPDEKLCTNIKAKEDEKKEALDKKDGESVKKIDKELKELYDNADEQAYSHILKTLQEEDKIFMLQVPLATILDFSGVDPGIISRITSTATPKEKKVLTPLVESWSEGKKPRGSTAGETQRVYYAYLGDILEVVLKNATNEDKLKAIGHPDPASLSSQNIATTNIMINGLELNIAMLPVDLRLFADHFYSSIIEPNLKVKSLHLFVSELLTKVMEGKIEKQMENFTVSRREYKTTMITADNSLAGLVDSNQIKASFKGGTSYGYLTVYTSPKDGEEMILEDKSDYAKSKKADQDKNGIYHLVFGSNDSIVKSANFQKTTLEFEQERRIAEGSSPYSILRNVFDVGLSLYGNTMFYPGRFVYINPSYAIGDGGRPYVKGSVFNIMGLGGYHIITGVTNTISDGSFETQLETKFVSSGESKE
jgi:hypothetical protein